MPTKSSMKKTNPKSHTSWLDATINWSFWDEQIQLLNTSKIFAGFIVITLNIASKFVQFKFSKGFDHYLRYSLSRNVLIFCMAWMGSRDIYTAIGVTLVVSIVLDWLWNDRSSCCLLPEHFKDYEPNPPSDDEIKWAKDIMSRASLEKGGINTPGAMNP